MTEVMTGTNHQRQIEVDKGQGDSLGILDWQFTFNVTVRQANVYVYDDQIICRLCSTLIDDIFLNWGVPLVFNSVVWNRTIILVYVPNICQCEDIMTNFETNGDVNSTELRICRSNKSMLNHVIHLCLHFPILFSAQRDRLAYSSTNADLIRQIRVRHQSR
jgi:hypothetical protein